mgnify:CR=1 FL=1
MLRPEAFFVPRHRSLWQAILTLYGANRPVDAVTVRQTLIQQDAWDEAGGTSYLADVIAYNATPSNAAHYAQIVRDKAYLRQVIVGARTLADDAGSSAASAEDVRDAAGKLMLDLTDQGESGEGEQVSSLLPKVYAYLTDPQTITPGIGTGITQLTSALGGLKAGEVVVIAGRPSMGKTSLGLNIAANVAVQHDMPVCIFSMEMGRQSVAERLLCSEAQVCANSAKTSPVGVANLERMKEAKAKLAKAPIIVDDTPMLSPPRLRAKARRYRHHHGIELAVIDYLQLMEFRGMESRHREVGMLSRHVKALARELNIPVLLISQLNRAAEARESHRPRMSDLRESGDIEQDADQIILLYRQDYYKRFDKNYTPNGMANIDLAKNRNGPTAEFQLCWQGEFMLFSDNVETKPF